MLARNTVLSGQNAVVVEVVLDRPQGVEAELVGQHAEVDLLGDDLPVGDLGAVAPRLEDHLDADVHGRRLPHCFFHDRRTGGHGRPTTAGSWRWPRCARSASRAVHALGRARLPALRRRASGRTSASSTSATSRRPRSPPRRWPSSPAGPGLAVLTAGPGVTNGISAVDHGLLQRLAGGRARRPGAAGPLGRRVSCRRSTTCRCVAPITKHAAHGHGRRRHRPARRPRGRRDRPRPRTAGPVFVDFPLDVVFGRRRGRDAGRRLACRRPSSPTRTRSPGPPR